MAVSEGKTNTNTLTVDPSGEGDGIADAFLAGGVADADGAVMAGLQAFAGVEGALWGKERELQFPAGEHLDVAGPDGRIGGTGVDFGRDGFNAGNFDQGAVTNEREGFGAGGGQGWFFEGRSLHILYDSTDCVKCQA